MSTSPSSIDPAAFRNSDVPPRDAAPPPVPPQVLAEAVAADVRRQVVYRVRTMNLRHGQAAWRQRRRDPLAPYALTFLFAWPDPDRPQWSSIAAATRMWLAGPETAHLPRLLFALDQHAVDLSATSDAFDIRTVLANRADPMPERAAYTGIAVSSLDTYSGTWAQVCQNETSELNLCGRALIVMTDGAFIACERRGVNEFKDFRVTSNRSLEVARGSSAFPTSWASPEDLLGDEADKDTWRFLRQLNHTLWRVDNARLSIASERREGNRGR